MAATLDKDTPPTPQKIVVGVHESFPWSYSEPGYRIAGQEKEIIEKAFKTQNIEVQFQIFSYSRLIAEFQNKRLDFASPIAFEIPGAFYTERFLPFHDVAVTLKTKGLRVDALADLTGKSVVAYQQAEKVLGPEFSARVSKEKYQELAERDIQIQMLFDGKVDVVVGEERVSGCLTEKHFGKDKVSIHPIFKQVSYGAAAWDSTLVDQFQAGLKAIKRSGVYQKILNKPCPITQE
jgi:polar amino acid transport system substrate-binding protein